MLSNVLEQEAACTYDEAAKQARQIVAYWFERSHFGIRAVVIDDPSGGYTVRTNIGPDGFPPKD